MKYILILLAFVTLGVQAQKKDRVINNKITPDSVVTQKLRTSLIKFNDGTSMNTAAIGNGSSFWQTTAGGIKYKMTNDSVVITESDDGEIPSALNYYSGTNIFKIINGSLTIGDYADETFAGWYFSKTGAQFRNLDLSTDITLHGDGRISMYTDGWNQIISQSSQLSSGLYNTVYGGYELGTDGSYNCVFGSNALMRAHGATHNVAMGYQALYKDSIGDRNIAIGSLSLMDNKAGSYNTAIGHGSLQSNLGSSNIAIGAWSGFNNTTLNNRLFINSISRGSTNVGNDTTMSIIYGLQASGSIAYQKLYFNGNTYTGQKTLGNYFEVAYTGRSFVSQYRDNVKVFGTNDYGDVEAKSYKVTSLNTAPSSSTDTGTAGEIRVTADYIYICTATNTWKRVAISTW